MKIKKTNLFKYKQMYIVKRKKNRLDDIMLLMSKIKNKKKKKLYNKKKGEIKYINISSFLHHYYLNNKK